MSKPRPEPLLCDPPQKGRIKRCFYSEQFAVCLSEKRWRADANQQIEERYNTGSLVRRIGSNFSLPGVFLFLVCLETPLLCMLGSEGLLAWGRVVCVTQRIKCFLCVDQTFFFFFFCHFEPNHVVKKPDLTFAFTLLASTVPACCL